MSFPFTVLGFEDNRHFDTNTAEGTTCKINYTKRLLGSKCKTPAIYTYMCSYKTYHMHNIYIFK